MFVGVDLEIPSQEGMSLCILTSRKANSSIASRFLPPFQLLNRTLHCHVHHLEGFKKRFEHLRPVLMGDRVNDNVITRFNQSSYAAIKTLEESRGGS